jgi:hypothetical protein
MNYTKVTALINGEAEVIYITASELERCRNRVGKEGCEDDKVDIDSEPSETITVAEVWNMTKSAGNARRRVSFAK